MSKIDIEKIFLDRQVDEERTTGTARIKCPSDFAAFEGHFPGEPILPGVIQLAAVRNLASFMAGVELVPVSTERIKFSGMVKPEEEIDVTMKLEPKGDLREVRFRLKRSGDKISAGTILYRETGG